MISEDRQFKKLMRYFRREIRYILWNPTHTVEEDLELHILLREIQQPIQENRVQRLLHIFLDFLKKRQEEIDNKIEDNDYINTNMLEAEWYHYERIVSKVEDFLSTIECITPPIRRKKDATHCQLPLPSVSI